MCNTKFKCLVCWLCKLNCLSSFLFVRRNIRKVSLICKQNSIFYSRLTDIMFNFQRNLHFVYGHEHICVCEVRLKKLTTLSNRFISRNFLFYYIKQKTFRVTVPMLQRYSFFKKRFSRTMSGEQLGTSCTTLFLKIRDSVSSVPICTYINKLHCQESGKYSQKFVYTHY
jgi:hypothetical protein